MSEFKAEDYAAAIIGLRSERERLLSTYEAADGELKSQMKVIEARLLVECNRINADSIKTQSGTIIRKLNERFNCVDWENFKQFESNNREYDFRERRVAQGIMKTYLSEHKDDGLPPGVDVMREYVIVVRKPS
jgi:hypothetical protein